MTDSPNSPKADGANAAVNRLPVTPVMIFDGDCGFCRFWIERWRAWTKGRVEFVPYQDATVKERFPEVPVAQCEQAVQLVERDGRVFSGAAAVFQSLAGVFVLGWFIRAYRRSSGFAKVTEAAYRLVATRRMFFSRLNRWLWGTNPELPRYELTSALLVRAVGLILLVGFISLWVQLHGLVGENGILPAGDFIRAADAHFDQRGESVNRYFVLPTLGWLASGDAALHVYCLLGVAASLLAMLGGFPAVSLTICWLLYLTLMVLGQVFLSYQWDVLLLEAGFLALLLAPWSRRLRYPAGQSIAGILLVRWLVFRLMFESGAVKLLSGDPTWRDLTAMQYHFETQPLPHWFAWYAHQMPGWMLKSAAVGMFFIELVVPFLVFAPRRLRLFAAAAFALLQFGIIATGNYGLFNWLSLVLCLALLDDRAVGRVVAWCRRLARRPAMMARETCETHETTERARRSVLEIVRRRVLIAAGAAILLIGAAQLDDLFGGRQSDGGPVTALRAKLEPFHLVNSYGLFAVMTTTRPELTVEGSFDGIEWRAYQFKYKPGALDQRPGIVPFHMPRLDWQMWFAGLQERNPPRWLEGFARRLFERSPQVLGLLASDPFPDQPPRYLRIMVADYRFTNAAMRRNTGQWWLALNRRFYVPIMSWENVAPPAALPPQ